MPSYLLKEVVVIGQTNTIIYQIVTLNAGRNPFSCFGCSIHRRETPDSGRACSSDSGGQIDDQLSVPMLIPVLMDIDWMRM